MKFLITLIILNSCIFHDGTENSDKNPFLGTWEECNTITYEDSAYIDTISSFINLYDSIPDSNFWKCEQITCKDSIATSCAVFQFQEDSVLNYYAKRNETRTTNNAPFFYRWDTDNLYTLWILEEFPLVFSEINYTYSISYCKKQNCPDTLFLFHNSIINGSQAALDFRLIKKD